VAAAKACVAGLSAFCRDGFTCSLVVSIFGLHVVTTFVRTDKWGHPRKPRCGVHPELGYR